MGKNGSFFLKLRKLCARYGSEIFLTAFSDVLEAYEKGLKESKIQWIVTYVI